MKVFFIFLLAASIVSHPVCHIYLFIIGVSDSVHYHPLNDIVCRRTYNLLHFNYNNFPLRIKTQIQLHIFFGDKTG